MRRCCSVLAATMTLAVVIETPLAFSAEIWVVGVMEETAGKYSRCKAMSEDGQWVVGLSRKSGLDWPFFWSKGGGLQDMGNPGGTNADVTGCARYDDGSLCACGNIGGLGRKWQSGSWSILPPQPGGGVRSVYAMTHDLATGTTWIAGSSYPVENEKAYRYHAESGSYIDYWGYYQDAYGVAHNGWAVGKNNWGNGQTNPDWRYNHPIFIFDWTKDGGAGGDCGWDQLKRFAGYGDTEYYKGQATAIGPSAKWATGYLTYNPSDLGFYHAFKWQIPASPQLAPEPGLTWARPVDLGVLGGGDTLSFGYCISNSATNPVIGGTSYGTFKYGGYKAVYWDNAGVHDLYAVLEGLGVDMARWASLARVYGISADGNVMVGYGAYDDDNDPGTAPVDMGFLVDLVSTTPQPPTITQQPAPQTSCFGGMATFTVVATGAGSLTYQWQKNQVDLTNGGHYAGVTTTRFTVTNADADDVANYRCVVANLYGSATSNEVALSLAYNPPPTPADGAPTADGADRITWKWADVAGETGYRVKDAGGMTKSGDLPADTSQWQENAISANTLYTRMVYAYNPCGESAGSAGQSKYTAALAPTYGSGTASPTVSCDKSSSSAGLIANSNVTFTATNGFGSGANKVGQFGYLWNQNAGNPSSWTGEQYWTTGQLVKQVGSNGTTWYLHLRSYNDDSPKAVNTTVLNLGPYSVGGTGFTCLQNAGFESGFTSGVGNNWAKYNYSGNVTCADDTVQYHGGLHSQRIDSSSSSNEGGVYQRFDVASGQSYTVRAWLKCSNMQIAPYIGLDAYGGTDPQSGTISWTAVPTSTTWVQSSQTITAASSVITVYLDAVATGTAGSLWVDDAEPACSDIPSPPIDGTPVALGTTSIRWNWSDVANETGYRVKDTGGTSMSGDLAANTTHWDEVTGIAANTQYTRRIYAFNASGESGPSSGQTLYSLIQTPSGLTFGTLTAASINVSADGPFSNLTLGNSGVRVSNTTTGSNSGWQTSLDTWTSSGLAANTQYSFVARARSGDAIETADCASADQWTLSVPPTSGSIIPDKPTACVNQTITWTAVNGFGAGQVAYYRYAWDQEPTHTWTDLQTQWSGGTITTMPTAPGAWYLHVQGYNFADVANGTYDYSVTTATAVAADFDGDCDVDQDDYDLFEVCASGAGVPHGAGCSPRDLDVDGDIDQADFAVFQRCCSGENTPADPDCAS